MKVLAPFSRFTDCTDLIEMCLCLLCTAAVDKYSELFLLSSYLVNGSGPFHLGYYLFCYLGTEVAVCCVYEILPCLAVDRDISRRKELPMDNKGWGGQSLLEP